MNLSGESRLPSVSPPRRPPCLGSDWALGNPSKPRVDERRVMIGGILSRQSWPAIAANKGRPAPYAGGWWQSELSSLTTSFSKPSGRMSTPSSLPPSLHWIEIDFPDVIELKEVRLADEKPNCKLDRIKLDLLERLMMIFLPRCAAGKTPAGKWCLACQYSDSLVAYTRCRLNSIRPSGRAGTIGCRQPFLASLRRSPNAGRDGPRARYSLAISRSPEATENIAREGCA